MIFLDESSKDERTLSRSYGYSFVNQPAIKKVVFIRGTRYTVLPALTMDGFIACDIMKGSCSKEKFRTFILSQVVSIYNLHLDQIFICFMIIKLILMFVVTFDESFSW